MDDDSDLKLVTFAITIRLNQGCFFDDFASSIKREGFKQTFFTVGKLVAQDKSGKSIESNSHQLKNEKHFSDKYNLHGKCCSVFPNGDSITIHRNFSQDGGLPENKILNLAKEIEFILTKLYNTTPTLKDLTSEYDFLAVFEVTDRINPDGTDSILFDDSIFDDMDVRKSNGEILLNPNMIEDMTHDEISETMRKSPELFSRKLGWNQIKVKNMDPTYRINFEYKDNDVNKILDMIKHPEGYLRQIVKKITFFEK